jgi:hypothetical protein
MQQRANPIARFPGSTQQKVSTHDTQDLLRLRPMQADRERDITMTIDARWNRTFRIVLVALLASLWTASAPAQAQVVKPFKITGEGVGPTGLPLPGQAPRTHWIIGEATHLGRHYGEGTVRTDSAVFDPTTGTIVGQFGSGSPFVFAAANGDRLVTWYGRTDHGAGQPGSFVLTIVGVTGQGDLIVQAAWIAEFVPVPGESTGRFAGVTGSWTMYAYSEPFVLGSEEPAAYRWQGEGRLTFREGRP